MTATRFRLPEGWTAEPVDGAETTELQPGVSCTPRLRIEPAPGAPGYERMVLSVLDVTAESAAAIDALGDRLVAEEDAHAGDPDHQVLRWIRVYGQASEALTSAHFMTRTPGSGGRACELVVAHVRGDMRTDETAAASVGLAGAIVATAVEVA